MVSLQPAAKRLSININRGGDPRDGDTGGNSPEPISFIVHRLPNSYQMVSIFTHCYSWTNNEKNDTQTTPWLLYHFPPTASPHFSICLSRMFHGKSLLSVFSQDRKVNLTTNSNFQERKKKILRTKLLQIANKFVKNRNLFADNLQSRKAANSSSKLLLKIAFLSYNHSHNLANWATRHQRVLATIPCFIQLSPNVNLI